jgi:hypothetical protein
MNHSSVSLFGALCVAADLVSQDDLDACLLLQRTVFSGIPIGQILLQQGYISALDLALILAQQQNFRRTIFASLESFFTYMDTHRQADRSQPPSNPQSHAEALDRVR